MAISRRTMAFSALIASVGGGAWARGQSLPVSNPREMLASDPAAFVQLLDDFRPSPVTSETKQMVLKSLPRELKGRAVNARGRAKLEGLSLVLRAVQRDAVYETRVFQSPWATIALDGRAVLLISERALEALDADQLRAAVAHEAAHEYVWEEWQRADQRDDWKRLRELELVCDGIAVVILQQLDLETSSLIRGFEKLTYSNLLWRGSPPNPSRYPTLVERRKFAREVAVWMTGLSRKDASGRAPACCEAAGLPVRRALSMSPPSSLPRLPPPSRSGHGRQPDGTPQTKRSSPALGPWSYSDGVEPTKPSLAILYPGNCEPLKASFHGVALILAAVMGAYNAAAWVRRRQSHLAINATIYIAAVFWEQRHVAHHLLPCLPPAAPRPVDVHVRAQEGPPTVKAA